VGAGSLCLTATKELVYNAASDACLPSLRATKHDIERLSLNALDLVDQLSSVSFIYNEGSNRTRYGFIAEDTALVNPHLATYNAEGEISGIDDRALLSVLVQALQELRAQVGALAARTSTVAVNAATSFSDLVTSRLTVGSETAPAGMTLYDRQTGTPQCVSVSGGTLTVTTGRCETAAVASSITSTETVNPVDTQAPVITLVGNNPAELTVGESFIDPGATVRDNIDQNLPITVVGADIDTRVAGSYTITYNAVDNAGNRASEVTRTVMVQATEATPVE
jgi:hypothetical protein